LVHRCIVLNHRQKKAGRIEDATRCVKIKLSTTY
jgi:hypothetical protein